MIEYDIDKIVSNERRISWIIRYALWMSIPLLVSIISIFLLFQVYFWDLWEKYPFLLLEIPEDSGITIFGILSFLSILVLMSYGIVGLISIRALNYINYIQENTPEEQLKNIYNEVDRRLELD